ncbi:hypothetical protein [Paracoccus siganidrum]|uniref:Glycosyltransferase n=1 Tax=Paracoccus siganidrum TaxID=1276757 RepID=A0A419A8T0_9RHOB|nr:hypothetical protein [Paracoccus siganidrum]RJL18350.1 hypothetical protein D3P05_07515 [Paracoccus siganidrum]RMC31514.1 hypothetical protein C9E82_15885 [Paracoccus siganidrum]
MADIPVNILCMKWGTLYTAQDVNNLFHGVRRNLARPFRFVCFTDDARDLDPQITSMPLPDLGLPQGSADTRWRKLSLFRRDLGGLQGTALFLDLDLVIVGGLDPFFSLPGEVLIIRDDDLFRPKPLRRLRPARDRFLHMVGNTSVFRFRIGNHAEILETYLADPIAAAASYEHEQQMVSDLLDRQGKLGYWPRGWCVSFKNDCVGRGLRSYLSEPRCPADARIVLFAGAPKMAEVLAGKGGKWYRRVGNVDWLRRAWAGE